jgi:hypothetical protein
MSDDARAGEWRPRSGRRLFFAFGLILLVVMSVHVLAGAAQPKAARATALFEVRNSIDSISCGKRNSQSAHDFEILKRTQLALLRQRFVLTSALVDPAVAKLSILNGVQDKVKWLQEHLEIEFPQESEILSISLSGSPPEDLVRLVDAVVAAYKKEVLDDEKQRRLMIKDRLELTLKNLSEEITRKYEDYFDIAKGMGRIDANGTNIHQRIGLKRLDRIDDELMQSDRDIWRMASNGVANDSKMLEATKQRMAELTKRRELLEKELQKQAEKSAALITKKGELDQLQRIVDDLNFRLEQLDLENQLPYRIRQLQSAILTQ